MDSIELGKKIKEARLTKKMTQSEVVGNFITRNMLSQIESGTATPSIKTLEYLSGVLELPLDQMIGHTFEEELCLPKQMEPLRRLIWVKDLLMAEKYEEVISACGERPMELVDEFSAILARACLGLAAVREREGNYPESAELVRRSLEYCDLGIYANQTLKTEGVLLLNNVAGKLGQFYTELMKE